MQHQKIPVLILAFTLAPAWAAEVQAPGVPNFHQVNEHLYRGGQPANAAWNSLAHLGIRTVIDLRPTGEHSTTSEARAVQAAGMRYVNVPMKGFVAPSDAEVSKVLALFDSNSDGSVFVHCRRGSDRTGTVIACYRITRDHWKNDKALKEATAYGMYSFEVGMRRYIKNFKPAERIAAGSDLPPSARQPATN